MDAEAESAIAISQYHANTDADEVDLALVEALLMYVCGEGVYKREGDDPKAAQGAVLVFLPGNASRVSYISAPFLWWWLTCCNAGLSRSISPCNQRHAFSSNLYRSPRWRSLIRMECGVA